MGDVVRFLWLRFWQRPRVKGMESPRPSSSRRDLNTRWTGRRGGRVLKEAAEATPVAPQGRLPRVWAAGRAGAGASSRAAPGVQAEA